MPHVPQFPGSMPRAAQYCTPLLMQALVPLEQPHVPLVQACPPGHGLPQPPQFCESVLVLVHAPVAPAQKTIPELHVGLEHLPVEQVCP